MALRVVLVASLMRVVLLASLAIMWDVLLASLATPWKSMRPKSMRAAAYSVVVYVRCVSHHVRGESLASPVHPSMAAVEA